MPTTSTQQLRYPASTDSPNGPLQIQNLASDVDGRLPTIKSGQGIVAGTAPTSDGRMTIKAYSILVATNASGDATHSFPGGAFINTIASVVVSSGDVTAGSHATAAVNGTATISAINTRHYQPNGSPCANVTVRLNVIACGF